MSTKNVDFLILCGGLGTRLREVVSDRPKALARVGERPFLELQIRYLVAQGARRVVLCTGHLSAVIEEWLASQDFGCEIRVSMESEPLGTGGAVALVETSERFFVLNGDSFCEFSASAMLERGGCVRIASVWVEDTSRYGRLEFDDQGRITRFCEKQPGAGPGWINAGIYLFEREYFLLHRPVGPFSLERDFCPKVSDCWIHQLDSPVFLDIGTPDDYRRAQEVLAPRFL